MGNRREQARRPGGAERRAGAGGGRRLENVETVPRKSV